ncbi:MAG: ATP-dependent protease LonB [Clostridia bacterium]|nr:ATP-dependent protease LonB [Clostridia bacterium]
MLSNAMMAIQFFFTVIIGLYFWSQLRSQQDNKTGIQAESKKEMERLHQMRKISLAEPLTEKARPTSFDEIIGQEDGVKALKIALCGPNPQHVIIYGPPGIGKTAAARVALAEAIKMGISSFKPDAKFIETDATVMRFDERSIADPLIGSVHDPIYQGAGAYGQAGVPQPKEGAVSKAHGGVLFIDEIGELHPIQMNKLLKVLEDRKVMFESAYYSSENRNIPRHIHDIFQNGIPADFRLIGATTRSPEEIPPAVRSRCVEIFFRPLDEQDLRKIVENAATKLLIDASEECKDLICRYAKNGRDCVRILQTAASAAILEKRNYIALNDVEWVIEMGRYTPNYEIKISDGKRVGVVNGLAVSQNQSGIVLCIETTAERTEKGMGKVTCTGIVEKESMEQGARKFSRTSTAKAAIDNVMTALKGIADIDVSNYNVHINFPGGMPVDGPSAGIAIFCSVYSAIKDIAVDNLTALTGEVSIKGLVKPVGGVAAKIEAAKKAGIKKIVIPKENSQKSFENSEIKIIYVSSLEEILKEVFGIDKQKVVNIIHGGSVTEVISASELKN